METLVRGEIIEHMNRNKLFSKNTLDLQVEDQRYYNEQIQVLDKWTEILDKGG
jgi:hypothetical protein